MKKDSASHLLKSLESGYSLPTLSVVALKLVELASDDTCSASDLANLIAKDPSLAVRLLKLANSAFFQSSYPVSTLEQALVKVGFHRLRIMALSLSLRDTFPMGKVGPLDYEKFWRSSLYRALLAKALAQHMKTCSPEEAFVAGLILEIGLLIFFDLLIKGKDEGVHIDPDALESFLAWEKGRYGIDHRQIGETALRYWKFPDSIVGCQSLYGNAAVSEGSPALVRICELAREFSGIMFQRSRNFTALFIEADKSLGLDPKVINDILLSTFEQVQDIAENLSLDLNGEKDLMEIMEKANRALSQISERMSDYRDKATGKSLPSFESLIENGEIVTHTLRAVAHEIRNPLLAVGGFAKRLTTTLDPSSDVGKYAHVILEEALRLEKALSKMTREN
ncbi:MAG: HDOD domain-containing protein [Deltaproteobacteria bacterium]|nr:HDOD domain-containing protein [Deltaproteobacteria bacterium]